MSQLMFYIVGRGLGRKSFKYVVNDLRRKFWFVVSQLRPFDNVACRSAVGQWAHLKYMARIPSTRGWHCVAPGRLEYTESY
jgi:hypothetical protein